MVAAHGLAFVGPPWLAEYLLVSQRPDTVVEISGPVRLALDRSIANRLYPGVGHVPNATFGHGYFVKIEDLLSRSSAVALQTVFVDRVRAYGLCAVPLGAKYGTDAAIDEDTQTYAALAKSSERAARLWSRFQYELGVLAQDVSAAPQGQPPRVVVMSILPYGRIVAEGGLHPATTFIARAGGVNALAGWRSRGVRLDAERLYALDPDYAFFVQLLGSSGPTAIRASRLGKLRAIAEGRSFTLPADWTLMNSVVATPSYERWMAEHLHPGIAGSARASLRRAYKEDLGVDLPEAWVEGALSEERW